MFGDRFDLYALLAFADSRWIVGDLGCGTGRLTATLAQFVHKVIAVDSSRTMLTTAEMRLASRDNVELRRGSLEKLPIAAGELDAAAIVLALHHVAEPRTVLREAARALKPNGTLIIIDMQTHDQEKYQTEMGHVWLGFSADHLQSLCTGTGLRDFEYHPLPTDLAAKGPPLFVARGRLQDSA